MSHLQELAGRENLSSASCDELNVISAHTSEMQCRAVVPSNLRNILFQVCVVFTKDTLHYVCTHLSKTFSNWSLLLSSSLTDYQSKAN